jgi:hypothetical protein
MAVGITRRWTDRFGEAITALGHRATSAVPWRIALRAARSSNV